MSKLPLNSSHSVRHIGILGAGGWGTALSILLQSNGHRVTLWEYRSEVARQLAATRENELLPGVHIPEGVEISSDLAAALREKDMVVIALPSHVVRAVAQQVNALRPDLTQTRVVSGVKGIENSTLLRMSQVLLGTVQGLKEENLAVLSGPSHAEEVSRKIPTAVVVSSTDPQTARLVQETFMSPEFRVYASRDLVGVELGGALKNIIALAAGICDGVGYGDNTKAALMNRGLVEITRLGVKMGADPKTFAGLSGMGDLIVTCMSRHSRNRYVGQEIGKGRKLDEVLAAMKMVAEGVRTTPAAFELSQKYNIEMPITREVYRVLFEGKDPKTAVFDLMMRKAKYEDWG